MNTSVKQAAITLVNNGDYGEGLLNKVESAMSQTVILLGGSCNSLSTLSNKWRFNQCIGKTKLLCESLSEVDAR